MKTDIEIQGDVIEQLQWEPAIDAAGIGVGVKNGIVTLSGKVDTYLKKILAVNAARKVANVKAVAEDIQVGPLPGYQRTDTEIAEAVVNALKWNSNVPDDRIKIKVDDGVVTLDGEVKFDFQRVAAHDAVEKLYGVVRVNNFISVIPKATQEDVERKITAAFHRSATLDADKITVEVLGNTAILKGKVRSFAESEDAARAAWAAPGITHVDNRLEIDARELVF